MNCVWFRAAGVLQLRKQSKLHEKDPFPTLGDWFLGYHSDGGRQAPDRLRRPGSRRVRQRNGVASRLEQRDVQYHMTTHGRYGAMKISQGEERSSPGMVSLSGAFQIASNRRE
jgi:hypothetical protein